MVPVAKPRGPGSVKDMLASVMSQEPAWSPGLFLTSTRYSIVAPCIEVVGSLEIDRVILFAKHAAGLSCANVLPGSPEPDVSMIIAATAATSDPVMIAAKRQVCAVLPMAPSPSPSRDMNDWFSALQFRNIGPRNERFTRRSCCS